MRSRQAKGRDDTFNRGFFAAGRRRLMAGLPRKPGLGRGSQAARQGTAATVATGTAEERPRGRRSAPVRETDRLAETDSSRDRSNSFATTGGVETPRSSTHVSRLGLWLTGVLGTDTVTGTTPNYTHTITPASALPLHDALARGQRHAGGAITRTARSAA